MAKGKSDRVAVKRRYPLHATLLIYSGVSLLVAIGAFTNNNNLLFWLFGMALGMMVVSGVISGAMMMALRVERTSADATSAGQEMIVRYRVTNTSRWMPGFALTISEQLDQSSTTDQEQAGVVRSAPRGFVGYVPTRSTIEAFSVCRAEGRGRVRLSGFEVMTAFPFGIIRKALWYAAKTSVIVTPTKVEVDQSILDQEAGMRGGGDEGKSVGRAGMDPLGVREYRAGDAIGQIAWRLSARRPSAEDLLVRQVAEGEPRRLWVVVELDRAKAVVQSERAISTAARVISMGSDIGLHVGVLLTIAGGSGPRVDVLHPPAGAVRKDALVNMLALLRVDGGAEKVREGQEGRVASGVNLGTGQSRVLLPRGATENDLIVRVSATGDVVGAGKTSNGGRRTKLQTAKADQSVELGVGRG